MTSPLPDDLTFEDALARLEQIVNQLEQGDLTLDESVNLFELGQQLTAFCQQALDSAELRVQNLASD
jgi:exodeoxyribonuclease VII small subunit